MKNRIWIQQPVSQQIASRTPPSSIKHKVLLTKQSIRRSYFHLWIDQSVAQSPYPNSQKPKNIITIQPLKKTQFLPQHFDNATHPTPPMNKEEERWQSNSSTTPFSNKNLRVIWEL